MNDTALVPEIALLSSNARAKYFEDCLEVLMLPRGMVQHFRYRSKYVDPMLLAQIGSRQIIGKAVVVCYVLQLFDQSGRLRPAKVHPIRSGTIVDAQVVGPSVHLYFAVAGYPSGKQSASAIASAVAAGRDRDGGPFSVATVNGLNSGQFSTKSDADAAAFSEIIDAFEPDDMQLISGATGPLIPCDPLFYRIDGLYKRGGKSEASVIHPSRIAEFSDRQRGYVLAGDDPHELRVQYHQPAWSKLDSAGMSLQVKTDSVRFANPDTDQLDVTSLYDQTEFYLLPKRTNTGWISRVDVLPENVPPTVSHGSTSRTVISRPFEVLATSKPAYPLWLVVVAGASSNLAAILISVISVIIALSSKASPIEWPTIVVLAVIVAFAFVSAIVRSSQTT